MKHSTLKVLNDVYFEHFPKEPGTIKIHKITIIISLVNKFFRGLFLLMLLGTSGFTMFFITSFVTQILFYTHFNYYTHRPNSKGEMQILNLYQGWYYKAINKMLFGIYFHKNHHRYPRLFNPGKLGPALDDVYISYPIKQKNKCRDLGEVY